VASDARQGPSSFGVQQPQRGAAGALADQVDAARGGLRSSTARVHVRWVIAVVLLWIERATVTSGEGMYGRERRSSARIRAMSTQNAHMCVRAIALVIALAAKNTS
jgi:hypothetical protein